MNTSWPVTPTEYAALLRQLEQSGISVDYAHRTAKKLGATVTWSYDGIKWLTIQSVKRSILTPATVAEIEAGLAKDIDAALEKLREPPAQQE
jgi:hypothetical protein